MYICVGEVRSFIYIYIKKVDTSIYLRHPPADRLRLQLKRIHVNYTDLGVKLLSASSSSFLCLLFHARAWAHCAPLLQTCLFSSESTRTSWFPSPPLQTFDLADGAGCLSESNAVQALVEVDGVITGDHIRDVRCSWASCMNAMSCYVTSKACFGYSPCALAISSVRVTSSSCSFFCFLEGKRSACVCVCVRVRERREREL